MVNWVSLCPWGYEINCLGTGVISERMENFKKQKMKSFFCGTAVRVFQLLSFVDIMHIM